MGLRSAPHRLQNTGQEQHSISIRRKNVGSSGHTLVHSLTFSKYYALASFSTIGRKEIIMFFYLYMLVTIMDFLLTSGIIPTSSEVYQVRRSFPASLFCADRRSCPRLLILVRNDCLCILGTPCLVFYRRASRTDIGHFLVSTFEWICWIPVCRGRNAAVTLGKKNNCCLILCACIFVDGRMDGSKNYFLTLLFSFFARVNCWICNCLVYPDLIVCGIWGCQLPVDCHVPGNGPF